MHARGPQIPGGLGRSLIFKGSDMVISGFLGYPNGHRGSCLDHEIHHTTVPANIPNVSNVISIVYRVFGLRSAWLY